MTHTVLVIFSAMLLITVFTEPLAKRLHLPFSALLVIIGFVGSETITTFGIDTGLRWDNFSQLILQIFLPILVFEAAFNLSTKNLINNIITIIFLAIPIMLISTLLIGSLLFYGIGYPTSFPWAAALLAGCILSATDPIAIISLFKQPGIPIHLSALLEGESLFNDATAIVLYMILISILLEPNTSASLVTATTNFLYTFIGGLTLGLAAALILRPLYIRFQHQLSRSIFTLIAVVISFYTANQLLHVSGVITVLAAGLLLGETHRQHQGQTFINELWELIAYITNALIFLLAGSTITWLMFTSNWLAMIIGIAAILIVRVLAIYGLLSIVSLIPKTEKLSSPQNHIMAWGGLRGAVTLALALSLPVELNSEVWFTIQSIAYGAVLFALFIQAPTMPLLIQKTLRK